MKVANRNIKSEEKGLEGGEMTRNDSVDHFVCGLIDGVEDLLQFRSNNNSLFISQDKLAS